MIDLGFNSAKLVNYEVGARGDFRASEQVGFKVKLGEGLTETGTLGEEPMRRTVERLKVFKDIIDLEGIVHVLPVATSAVREASNRYEFLDRVFAEAGFRFRVLTADEEALYSYAGAIGFLGLADVVFFDIGGGSLEIVRAKGFRIKQVLSLPLGALRLTYAYSKPDGSYSKAGLSEMKHRSAELLPKGRDLRVGDRTVLVGVGGTLRALARYDQALRGYPFNKVHNYDLTFDSVDSIADSFLSMSRRELAKINPVSNRAETVAAGSFVIRTMMKRMGFKRLTVSNHGLREGTLAMFLNDPRTFRSGRIDVSRIERYVSSGRGVRSGLASGPALALREARLIDQFQALILTEAHRLRQLLTQTTDLQALFYSILGEDSPFSHSDQLLMALLVVAAGNQRASEFLLDEYKPLLPRPFRKSIKKLSAAFTFTEATVRAKATVKLERRRNAIVARFYSTKPLPLSMLSARADDLGEAFDVRVTTLAGRGSGYLREAEPIALEARRR